MRYSKMRLQLLRVLGLTKYFKIQDWIELDTSASVEDFSAYVWKNFEKLVLWADRKKLFKLVCTHIVQTTVLNLQKRKVVKQILNVLLINNKDVPPTFIG